MDIFWKMQNKEVQDEYIQALRILGSLSHLFSESSIPYLYYRAHENAFCETFGAKDLSRGDISFDAVKDGIGIGLKTFLKGNGKTFQKVAEFNSDSDLIRSYQSNHEELIYRVAELRNKRITVTQNATNTKQNIYHLITREQGRMNIIETPMDLIDIDSIRLTNKNSKNTIRFQDNNNEYSFSLSKSTLSKRFDTTKQKIITSFDVDIVESPLQFLKQLDFVTFTDEKDEVEYEYIILPLYSEQTGTVQERVALNQWNAAGRTRDADEVYIPIPLWIHKQFKGFFEYSLMEQISAKNSPPFIVELPSGEQISCKIAQSGGKGLMSNPNKALGKWILRDVLKLKEKTLVTMELLKEIGIDSIKITKINPHYYYLDFMSWGSFEKFSENHKDS